MLSVDTQPVAVLVTDHVRVYVPPYEPWKVVALAPGAVTKPGNAAPAPCVIVHTPVSPFANAAADS